MIVLSTEKQKVEGGVFVKFLPLSTYVISDIPNEYLKRKLLCHFWCMSQEHVELCIAFIGNKGLKIKYAQLCEECFSVHSHMRFSRIRELKYKILYKKYFV